jgi:hypothetical protein
LRLQALTVAAEVRALSSMVGTKTFHAWCMEEKLAQCGVFFVIQLGTAGSRGTACSWPEKPY